MEKLRFKGFNNEWNEKTFQDIYIEASEGGTPSTSKEEYYHKGNIPFVKIEDANNKYINKTQSYITDEGLKNSSAWIVPSHSILFTNGATIGNVSINKIPVATKQGILGIITNKNYNIEFLYYLLSSSKFKEEVNKRTTKGTFSTIILKSINEINIKVPNIKEQEKIGGFLSAFDKLIEKQKERVGLLKKTYSQYLESLLNVNENNVPKLRFKNFNNKWIEVKISEIATINPKSKIPNEFNYVDLESVDSNKLISYRKIKKENAPSRAQRLALKGDLFFQAVRPYQKNNYLFNSDCKDFVFSTGYIQVRSENNSYYLLGLFQTNGFVDKVMERCTGTSYPAINSQDFSVIKVNITKDNQEQLKIGIFLYNITKLIEIEEDRLQKIKYLKQGYIQRIFAD